MSETSVTPSFLETARQRLVAQGQRVTAARLATLSTLLASPNALSHHDVEVKLGEGDEHFNRVTLYRILEWLVARGLAHKVAREGRSWRFSAILDENQEHPHFHCLCCGCVRCLASLQPALILGLPPGYTYQKAELTILGTCPACAVKRNKTAAMACV
jgi:Fur family ferric uptake transcriptional regulator